MANLDPNSPFANVPPVTQPSGGLDPNSPFANISQPTPIPTPIPTSVPQQPAGSTAQTINPTVVNPEDFTEMLGSLTKFPSPHPYNPNGPLIPETYSGSVKTGSFNPGPGDAVFQGAFDTVGNFGNPNISTAHLAYGLAPTIPEKLSFLQDQYPGTATKPNWFGEDTNGNIIFSQDKGKTWTSFESLSSDPKAWLTGHVPGVVPAITTAAGGLGGAIATGAPTGGLAATAGGLVGAAAGNVVGQQALRSASNIMGFDDRRLMNGPEVASAALQGAASQALGNGINYGIGDVATGLLNPPSLVLDAPKIPIAEGASLASLPAYGPLTAEEQELLSALGPRQNFRAYTDALSKQIKNQSTFPAQNPLVQLPLKNAGLGPWANEPVQPLLPGEGPSIPAAPPMTWLNEKVGTPIAGVTPRVAGVGLGAVTGGLAGHPVWGAVAGAEIPDWIMDPITNKLTPLISNTISTVPGSVVYNPGSYLAQPGVNGVGDEGKALYNLVMSHFGEGKKK